MPGIEEQAGRVAAAAAMRSPNSAIARFSAFWSASSTSITSKPIRFSDPATSRESLTGLGSTPRSPPYLELPTTSATRGPRPFPALGVSARGAQAREQDRSQCECKHLQYR